MSLISIIFVLIIAFFAGMGSVLDAFQFHQPVVVCTLIGIATGNPVKGIILGGTLQLITLGWMNIGAALAPDVAIASAISSLLVCGPANMTNEQGIAVAIPLAMAGLVLTTLTRTLAIFFVHIADKAAEEGSIRKIDILQYTVLFVQGCRVLIPTGIVLLVNPSFVQNFLQSIPPVITNGLAIGGGMIVVVGYAMVVNMMATSELWPFFFIGFAFAALTELNLIALGIVGLMLALVYLKLSPNFNIGKVSSGNGDSIASNDDDLDRILNNY